MDKLLSTLFPSLSLLSSPFFSVMIFNAFFFILHTKHVKYILDIQMNKVVIKKSIKSEISI